MTSDRAPEQGTDLVERLRRFKTLLIKSDASKPEGAVVAMLQEAATTITRLRLAAPVWRDIETAPKDGTVILTYWPERPGRYRSGFAVVRFLDGIWTDGEHSFTGFITRWQPLQPPTSQAAAVAGEDAAANPGNQPKERLP